MRGDDDQLLDALDHAAEYFDAGYQPGQGELRPSAKIIMRYCQLMSTGNPTCYDEAQRLGRMWLSEGRRRWKAGFAADPLAPVPVPRRT